MKKSIHTKEFAIATRILRECRERSTKTQADLAVAIGKTQTFVSKVERGETRLDIIQLRTFLAAAGTSLAEYVRLLERALRTA